MSERTGSEFQNKGSEYRPGNGDGRPAQAASDVVDTIREGASNLRDQVSDTVSSVADDQKNRAAEGVRSAAEATREAARRLEGSNQSWMAGVVESAAEVLSDFSDTIRHSDFRSLYDRVERFSRDQPVLFAAGAFAVGMVLARTTRAGLESTSSQSGMSGATGATQYSPAAAAGGPGSYSGPESYSEAGREY
jgi:hypothetical protein